MRLGSYCADWVAVVAVVEEHVGVLVQVFELLGGAGACAVVVLAAADGEVLALGAGNGAKSDGCNDCAGISIWNRTAKVRYM